VTLFCNVLKPLTMAVSLTLTWLSLGYVQTTSAMEITVEYTDNRPLFQPTLWVDMKGEIVAGDTERFLAAIKPYAANDVYEVVLQLDSPGGSLLESLELGQTISDFPYTTIANVGLENEPQICASACVNVYLGADYRYLSDFGQIGVHRFSISGTELAADEALSISQDLSAQILEHIRAMRADPEFFKIMVSAHAQDIFWVPVETLKRLHVVTDGIYSETAEYRNINGSIALYLNQVSRVGTNAMTLLCGERGLAGLFDLNEPELAGMGQLELYIDGSTVPLSDFEVIERSNFRLKALSLFPPEVLQRLSGAREIGARVTSPEVGIFFGFEDGVNDPKIAEMSLGCISSLGPVPVRMTTAEGIDFTGGDLTLNGYSGISFEQCQNICLNDNRCIAVSYVPSRSSCWPKNSIVATNPNPGVVSAYRE
jgi:hypothetical protein